VGAGSHRYGVLCGIPQPVVRSAPIGLINVGCKVVVGLSRKLFREVAVVEESPPCCLGGHLTTSVKHRSLRNNGRGRYRVVQRAPNRRRTWARGTLASRGSRAHIVTTFEAKESGVLAQSLGISGRLEWVVGQRVELPRHMGSDKE
jgi:hypothetical protein